MPLVKLQLQTGVAEEKWEGLRVSLSRILAEVTGKSESHVMVVVQQGEFLMAGSPGPAAFVDVRGIGGLTPEVNGRLTQAICELLQKEAGVPPARTYVTFLDVPASNWGWNGRTFG